MITLYCAWIFQTINYWDSDRVRINYKVESVERALRITDAFTYVSPEYGHEALTWGATLKECEVAPAEDLLEKVSYFVDFEGDGKVCSK